MKGLEDKAQAFAPQLCARILAQGSHALPAQQHRAL
jgi:hypothetical protein